MNKVVNTIISYEAYKKAVFELCENIYEDQKEVNTLYKNILSCESDVDFFTPIGHIVEVFSLSEKEGLALCVCAAKLWQYQTIPSTYELALLCGLQGEELHPIFNSQQDGLSLSYAVRGFILQGQQRLPTGVTLQLPIEAELFHSHEILSDIEKFCVGVSQAQGAVFTAVVITGRPGTGRTFLLSRLAMRIAGSLLIVDANVASDRDADEISVAATLYRSIVCIKNASSSQDIIKKLFSILSLLFFVDGKNKLELGSDVVTYTKEISKLSFEERRKAIEVLFDIDENSKLSENLSSLYNVDIASLIKAKSNYAAAVLSGNIKPGDEKLIAAEIKAQSSGKLGDNVDKLITNKMLNDVILPTAQEKQLRQISSFVSCRRSVYEKWNFNQKIPYGKGITVLFYGASGTGKTLAASAMANELGLDLFRVDLSQLISKYIGETQKNIGKIFDEAQNSDCILFFDEADALFSKRTDTGDAQDKYSNAEIAYLLQRTERYDGTIILATNLLQNFDEAFRRRIGFMIHFPMPDERLREKMWENIFPIEAPTDDINYGLLAKHIELSGAGIRNCAVNSALLAASEGGNITMNRVIRAAQMEYQKQNKQLPVNLVAMFADE